MESAYADNPGVPRYFNSYAERVVYNRLFATDGERTVLIPDNLFYAHTELADLLSQLKGAKAALPHLNAMVAYAPAYPFSHMKLAVQLARNEDWDSARAACLNALRVALDRDDAAFAYYRLAYADAPLTVDVQRVRIVLFRRRGLYHERAHRTGADRGA